jgi:hypothetical protein
MEARKSNNKISKQLYHGQVILGREIKDGFFHNEIGPEMFYNDFSGGRCKNSNKLFTVPAYGALVGRTEKRTLAYVLLKVFHETQVRVPSGFFVEVGIRRLTS